MNCRNTLDAKLSLGSPPSNAILLLISPELYVNRVRLAVFLWPLKISQPFGVQQHSKLPWGQTLVKFPWITSCAQRLKTRKGKKAVYNTRQWTVCDHMILTSWNLFARTHNFISQGIFCCTNMHGRHHITWKHFINIFSSDFAPEQKIA